MEDVINTECLRSMAPNWSLAGDKKLLSLLQDIHKNIMTRCHEADSKLEEMAISLDGAHVDLQNVNNKFMALSNSQFIESRVYDDDLDVTVGDTSIKKEMTASDSQDLESEISKLKQSLKVLESMHECVRIIDSDSDSDSEEGDGRMVYKPRDLYSTRPLPHIIGSQAWKSKWHAGILAEDSDSDSASSKPNDEVLEQYSESESEATDTRTDRLNQLQGTISSNSSMADSEPSVPTAPLTQASVAAELARKLGGKLPEIAVSTPEPVHTKQQVAPPHVYKPQNPAASAIFFDEPPPLEQSYQSDGDDSEDEEDGIFAELRKTKPSTIINKDQTRLNTNLFGGFDNSPHISGDLFGAEKVEPSDDKNSSETTKEFDKKPVGGISVFGSSKGTESISAAILRRAQRKDSSDEDSEKGAMVKTQQPASNKQIDSTSNASKNQLGENERENVINRETSKSEVNTVVSKEKDILQDIFGKNKPSKSKTKMEIKNEPIVKEKSDIFSDIFDDIDDIFTDPVVKVPIKEASKNAKSIFDDDDDDLFADIAVVSKEQSTSKAIESKARGIFDSDEDDDLFSEKPRSSSQNNEKASENIVKDAKVENSETKYIFNDDTDDNIFTEKTVKKSFSVNKENEADKSEDVLNNSSFNKSVEVEKEDDDNNNVFTERNSIKKPTDYISTTSRKEMDLTENESMIQVDNVANNNEHNNSNHENLNESMAVNSLTSENVNKTKHNLLDTEPIENSLNFEEHIIEDDWNDSNFAESESENLFESEKKDLQSYDKHSVTTNTTVSIENHEQLNVGRGEISSQINKEDVEPFNTVTVESNIENTNNFNAVTFEKENSTAATSTSSEVTVQKSDVFSDIFDDIPPAFEKPKEPKKSKNVNALFDDDSDDEALFFKKNDAISDEKPELDSSAKEDSLFRIFSDEPPAMDIDFTQKIIQSVKEETTDIKSLRLLSNDSEVISVNNKINNNENENFLTQPKEEQTTENKTHVSKNESKNSVSKLKSQININVNTLLPGASSKKSKVTEQVDGQVVSTEKISKSTDVESTNVKSVSFDGNADSGLLDNKLSKERAKIQVKRRPSTRRARREAVKKSGIDFETSDVTDNASGVDVIKSVVNKIHAEDGKEPVSGSINRTQTQNVKSKVVYILNDEDIFSNTDMKQIITIKKNISSKEERNNVAEDDDEIFRKNKVTNNENLPTEGLTTDNNYKSKQISEKYDDESKNKIYKENQNSVIIVEKKLEKSNRSEPSIFDDLSDDENELFQGNKLITSKTENIFGSDSEEELFGSGQKKYAEKTTEHKSSSFNVEVKKYLFDGDSNSDLFGSKPSSSGTKPHFIKSNETKPTNTQLVDEDPLSLFTNDENDDI